MPRLYRRLRPEFLERFAACGAHVKEVAVRDFVGKGRAFRTGSISALLQGETVPAHCVETFVRFCRQSTRLEAEPAHTACLRAWCAERGRPLDDPHTTTAAVVALISEPGQRPAPGPSWGIELVADMWRHVADPTHFVRPARDEAEVARAVEWLYVELGRIVRDAPLEEPEAVAAAERRIGIELAPYREATLARHAREPWTLALATDRRGAPIGASFALPVTAECYERVLRGEARPSWVAPDELCAPSPHLLLEGVAMRPAPGRQRARRASLPLVRAMIVQHAWLGVSGGAVGERPLRMLTFEGTPDAREGTAPFGFARTGTCLEGTDIPLIERRFHVAGHGYRDAMYFALWSFLRHRLAAAQRD